MTKLQFEPEDFARDGLYMPCEVEREYSAKVANAKLAEIKKAWVQEAYTPEYYNNMKASVLAELKASATVVQNKAGNPFWATESHSSDTHRAYLIGIEEIKPEVELTFQHAHEWDKYYDSQGRPMEMRCRHCGQKHKAKWEVVE